MSQMTGAVAPHLKHPELYIGGQWEQAAGGKRFDTENPYTGKTWARIADAAPSDVDRAVNAARAALDGPWGSMPGSQRARLMIRLAELIERDLEAIAAVETADNGKLIKDSRWQVTLIAEWFRYFAGLADKIEGRVVQDANPAMFVYTRREPIGVVAAILPWNAPLLLLTFKLAPALAAGCAFVAKPSEFTPASALALAERFHEAGFPPGVFNVLPSSSRETSAALVKHPGVDKVAFTGSTATGIAVAQSAVSHLARITLELGGKSPQLVFEDADVDAAVNGVLAGIFGGTGQVCHAGSRAFVQRSIYQAVLDGVVARAKTIKMGDPALVETEMGPIATAPQFAKVQEILGQAVQEGATVACGGGADDGLGGYFIRPTVLTDVKAEDAVMRGEVFGPVVCMVPFDTEEEGIAMANDTPYGLASGLWSRDVQRVHRVAKRLKAGTVWVNTYRRFAPNVPFGGMKASGIGRENGIDAVLEYTEQKAVWIELTPQSRDPFRV
ncbi:betaine aldehyde dehydrogenase, NAD-dependent [Rubrivivax sp. A210]|uniref:aldehyde dehydrogenase n=1 Tax=Rubrivivax sp. A210 TaxID=2772301 RepID=UPI001996FFFC|nr:aldehyde dehydrogenase [Rubrivivax sp. A210]CAD5372762.1 betaine aldehyde dehydrogenase, NAD-dependent [Rubrivivax sp. A210]